MTQTTTTTDLAATPTKKSFVSRWLTPVLALLAAVGIGVFGGVLIGQNSAASVPTGFTPPEGMEPPTGGGFGNATSGEITAIDGDVVTLTLDDGTTVTVTATGDTTVSVDGALSDLELGDTVTAIGEADDDGTVEATAISEGEGGFGGQRPASDG